MKTCLKASKKWCIYISNEKFPLLREIHEIRKFYKVKNSEHWGKILKNAPREILQEFLFATKNFFKNAQNQEENSWTPLHITAENGAIDLSKFILSMTDYENPKNENDVTPLHLAAKRGHLEIVKLILDKLDDKNPIDKNNDTPLHYAAKNGHLNICKLFHEMTVDINPLNLDQDSPLHLAAQNGHLEVCR